MQERAEEIAAELLTNRRATPQQSGVTIDNIFEVAQAMRAQLDKLETNELRHDALVLEKFGAILEILTIDVKNPQELTREQKEQIKSAFDLTWQQVHNLP